jgi:cytochrome c oxidase subunit 3
MSRIVSDRADKTNHVVVLPSSLENPNHVPPGTYRVGIWIACISIFAFFTALVIAYVWRSRNPPYWEPIPLPHILWLSTGLIVASSATFEAARRQFRHGEWRAGSRWLLATATLGNGFVASQLTAWRQLYDAGAFLMENPHSAFFYLFTGLHGTHLLGGLIALFVVLFKRNKRRETVDVVAYYWHFLLALWLILFMVLGTVS